MGLEAGKGGHTPYRVDGTPGDGNVLRPDVDYISVDAVSWFINKESTWFKDWTASGSMSISIAGRDKYEAALGTFALDNGSRLAPVFDRAVLAERAYRGGDITVTAALTGLRKATALGKMLSSAASASLGIVAGMVETAGATGPLKALTTAGQDLLGGVQQAIDATDKDNRAPFFDFSGVEFTLKADKFTSTDIYILLHRGTKLQEAALRIAKEGQRFQVYSSGSALEDGAWLLLRFRRSQRYGGLRPWQDAERLLYSDLENLRTDFKLGVIDKPAALAQLKPASSGSSTIFDRYVTLRTLVQADYVITSADAVQRVRLMVAAIENTKNEISAGVVGDAKLFAATGTFFSSSRKIPISTQRALESQTASFLNGRLTGGSRRSAAFQPTAPELFEDIVQSAALAGRRKRHRVVR